MSDGLNDMAVLLVILIGIVLSLIPFFIDKGKEQIQVKKVKDTFYTMTGSKFFSDTLLGKHFANAMKNKGLNYQRTLTSENAKELKEELYKIAFDYAVKEKMVWGQDDYTKAVIQFCNSNDTVIQRAYDMIIAEKKIIQSARDSVEHNGMPWMTHTSSLDSTSSTVSKIETAYDKNVYNERKDYLRNLQKGKEKQTKIKDIVDSSIDVFAKMGTEMSISAFVALHGDYVLKQTDNSNHYLQATDGTCAYFVQELEESFRQAKEKGEFFILDDTKLKVRKFYSTENDAISYKAYYNYKK